MERFPLQFRQHAGGADGLGNFHLFLAQSLQIIPIHSDLESASHHKRNPVSNYIKSIEIKVVNSRRGAPGDFRSLEDFFEQEDAGTRQPPETGLAIELAWTPSFWTKLLYSSPTRVCFEALRAARDRINSSVASFYRARVLMSRAPFREYATTPEILISGTLPANDLQL